MTDVFLSYASEDRDRVRPLVQYLERAGLSVWWDRAIVPGARFEAVIEEAMNAAKCVVVVWSRHSVSSAWVQGEAAEGLSRGALVPLLLEDVRPPLPFRHQDSADLRRWRGGDADPELERLLTGIRAVLAGGVQQHVIRLDQATGQRSPRKFIVAAIVLAVAGAVLAAGLLLIEAPAPAGLLPENSIAVAEIVDRDNGERNHLGFGFSGQVRDLLTRVDGLAVASRTSTEALGARDPRSLGELLRVRYLLEGTVTGNDDAFEIDLQLVDTESGYRVWSSRFRGGLDELLDLTYDASRAVVDTLGVELSAASASLISTRATDSREALAAYLTGAELLESPPDASTLAAAEAAFTDAISIDPGFAEGYAGLCQTLLLQYRMSMATDKFERARSSCEEALRLDELQVNSLIALGNLHLGRGDAELAIDYFESALELAPLHPEPVIGLGRAYRNLEDYQRADEWYRKAVRDFPSYPGAHTGYAALLFSQGRMAEAAQEFQQGVRLSPESATAHTDLGAAYFMMGDFESSLAAWEQAQQLEKSAMAYANTGTAYFFLNRMANARRSYEAALELVPDEYRYWKNLGDACAMLDARQCATDAFTRAISLQQSAIRSGDAASHALLGASYGYLGDRDQARHHIDLALAEASRDYYVYYELAVAYLRLQDAASARAMIEKSVALGYPRHLIDSDPQFKNLLSDPEDTQND